MSAHYMANLPFLDYGINGFEDCAKVKKAPRYALLRLSASLSISDSTASDILTCPLDNIHLSIFLPLK